MSVSLKLLDDHAADHATLKKVEQVNKNNLVEPFSPKALSRQDIENFHTANIKPNKNSRSLVNYGFFGLGLGLLSMLFAFRHFPPFQRLMAPSEY